MPWIRLLAPALAAALLVGCGGSTEPDDVEVGSPTGAEPDSPVATTPRPGDTDAPELVEPSPGMVDVHPVRWDEARVLDEHTVEVTWWSGVRPCHVLDHVEVDPGDERVTITLFEGSAPADEPQVCIEVAVLKRVRVELDEPLAGRELVDGAEPGPAHRTEPTS